MIRPIALATAALAAAAAADDWQVSLLLDPAPDQRHLERARQRVMIYDGLDARLMQQAMDEQFERIEHMMLVRVRHVAPDGEVAVEDDGCD